MNLFAELKRRNVIRFAGLYLVGAWLLTQVASTVLPMFGAPDWLPRSIVMVLALGYFAFDKFLLTPKRNAALAAAASTPTTDAHSLAVLPFVNMSGDAANEYFSDGISEEILNVLARTPELRVAARTSSFSFKGKTQEIPA